MSYNRKQFANTTYKQIELLFKEGLADQWQDFDRWGKIWDVINTHIPLNCSMLDLGSGNSPVKAFGKHNKEYLSIDLNSKAILQHDLDYDLLDLWQYRATVDSKDNKRASVTELYEGLPEGPDLVPWTTGLCVEVLEYIKDPVRLLNHYKQYAKAWIITIRVGRPDHIYEYYHPLQNRWRSFNEFENFLKPLFKKVTVKPIETTLTTCSGKMKPFAMAICEV
jgi:hypothetical protein